LVLKQFRNLPDILLAYNWSLKKEIFTPGQIGLIGFISSIASTWITWRSAK